MTFDQLRPFDLRAKLASLGEDLDSWEALSARGQPLAAHHSQIRVLGKDLRSLREALSRRIAQAEANGSLLASAETLEWQLLAGHRVFGFFRGVFAMRHVAHLQPLLAAADDLAWACWKPARDAALRGHAADAEALRAPPLVYFGGDASPVEMSRGTRFYFDVNAEEDVVDLRDSAVAVIEELSIPLISIPWFQLTYPPDLALIAHEVGHVVEDDFGLTDRITELVDEALDKVSAPAERRRAWHAWQGEVFADLYGCAALGTGFAGVLMAFIALSRHAVRTEDQDDPAWDTYPTRWLRACIAVAALRELGFDASADDLLQRWTRAFPTHRLESFEGDVTNVVHTLLRGEMPSLEGETLVDLLGFDDDCEASASRVAESLVNGDDPEADSVRELIAGAGLAFLDRPKVFAQAAARRRLLTAIAEVRSTSVRGAGPRSRGDPPSPVEPPSPAEPPLPIDLSRGEALAALLQRRKP